MVASHLARNRLLAALPRPVWDRLLPQLESVELCLGQVLHEARETQRHVFFPTTAIVSLLYVMENGAAAEIAVVGYDGIVGVPLFMGGQYTTSRAVVQSAGQALQLKAQGLMELIANMLGVRREGVTQAATHLQSDGLIRYARGHIRVLDRAGLEKRTCECYAVVRREYERLLSGIEET